jgi:hypothetical protein
MIINFVVAKNVEEQSLMGIAEETAHQVSDF